MYVIEGLSLCCVLCVAQRGQTLGPTQNLIGGKDLQLSLNLLLIIDYRESREKSSLSRGRSVYDLF